MAAGSDRRRVSLRSRPPVQAKAARAKQTTTSAPGAKSSPAGRPAKASAPAPAYQDEWTQQFVHDRVIPALPPASIVDRIAKFKVVMTRPMVRPRGLDNLGNMCYMNAMLHPLLYCGPFYNLLAQFQAAELRAVGLAPLLLAMSVIACAVARVRRPSWSHGPCVAMGYVGIALHLCAGSSSPRSFSRSSRPVSTSGASNRVRPGGGAHGALCA